MRFQQIRQLADVARFQFAVLPLLPLFEQPLLGLTVDGPAGDHLLLGVGVVAFEQLQALTDLHMSIGLQVLLYVFEQRGRGGPWARQGDGAAGFKANAIAVIGKNRVDQSGAEHLALRFRQFALRLSFVDHILDHIKHPRLIRRVDAGERRTPLHFQQAVIIEADHLHVRQGHGTAGMGQHMRIHFRPVRQAIGRAQTHRVLRHRVILRCDKDLT
ncbi:hypothetical protein D3C72_373740 [compost metagenome]